MSTAFTLQALFAGYVTALSLIMAIGAQNAFVLRQGIRRTNVLPIVLACAGSDAILITAGVFGFEIISDALPGVLPLVKYSGAAFLFVYGAFSFRAAWRAVLRWIRVLRRHNLPGVRSLHASR